MIMELIARVIAALRGKKSGVGSAAYAAYACPGARLLTSTRAELAMKVIGHKPQ